VSLKIATAAATVLLCSSAAEARRCSWAKWQSIPNQLVNSYLTAPSGKACRTGTGFRIAPPNTFREMRITERPRNGTATAVGHIITYRSRSGYVGSDTFVFTIYGTTHNGAPRIAQMLVNVTVE
jgi:hypothetical protein